jgi:hypothetical protein
MVIECMCVVCHGPLARKGVRTVTAQVCNDNGGLCRSVLRRYPDLDYLPWRYQDLRMMQEYRREKLLVMHRIGELMTMAPAIARRA